MRIGPGLPAEAVKIVGRDEDAEIARKFHVSVYSHCNICLDNIVLIYLVAIYSLEKSLALNLDLRNDKHNIRRIVSCI